jgi:paraquat-inducible protein A
VDLLEIPGVMFSEDYASLGTFFLLFVQIVPAFCLVVILCWSTASGCRHR